MTNNELATRVASLERVAIRFERLERGMRRWRRLAAVLVVGLVVGLVVVSWGEDEIPDVVEAREFWVVNKAGRVVANMWADGDGYGVVSVATKTGDHFWRSPDKDGNDLEEIRAKWLREFRESPNTLKHTRKK